MFNVVNVIFHYSTNFEAFVFPQILVILPEIYQDNAIVRHSFEFALMVDEYCAKPNEMRKYDLSRQLFRAGTSIGANVWEAQEPESRADFIHKMKIAAKEARESFFWLLLCKNLKNYPDCQALLDKLEETRKLLSAIIYSSKQPPLSILLKFFFPF